MNHTQSVKRPVRVRFAPSPTGHLHIGGLRAALFNWLFARSQGGAFLLRIEDTDVERSKKEFTQSILEAFSWTNIAADEPVVIQSSRKDEHIRVAQHLISEGKAYRCYCSSEEVAARYSASTDGDSFIKYDGHCKNRKAPTSNAPYVIRFSIPDEMQTISFVDLIRGEVTFERNQFDDFVIVRSDGWPTYNFVVVVDDAFMAISHVIRGEDHISNTPKQIMIYQACGYTLPEFAHLPMILGPHGNRLSKRDAATSVLEYRELGILPDALINYLVRLGWAHGDQEIFSRQEMIDLFTLDAVGKKGAIFSMEKLEWVNSVYMRHMNGAQLLDYATHVMNMDVASECAAWDRAHIEKALMLYLERTTTVKKLVESVYRVYHGPSAADISAVEFPDKTASHVDQLIKALREDPFTHDSLAATCKALAKKLGIKFIDLAMPIRVALTGLSDGPGVFDLMTLVGHDECMVRLQRLREHITS